MLLIDNPWLETLMDLDESDLMLWWNSLIRLGGVASSAGSRAGISDALSQQEEAEHHRKLKEGDCTFAGWLQPWNWGIKQRLVTGEVQICSIFDRDEKYLVKITRQNYMLRLWRCRSFVKPPPHLQICLFLWIQSGMFFSQSAGGYFCSGSSFANFQGALQTNLPRHHSAVARQCLWDCRAQSKSISAHCSRE